MLPHVQPPGVFLDGGNCCSKEVSCDSCHMRKGLREFRDFLRPFGPVLRTLLEVSARLCLFVNRLLALSYRYLWPILGIYWYDHDFDHLMGPDVNHWTERGTLAKRYIRSNDLVLDVGCGDGSFAGNYFAQYAAHVDAVDYDEKAIDAARRKHSKNNVNFFVADATTSEFTKKYNVILLFGAIQQFAPQDARQLLEKLANALVDGGTLFGSVPIFSQTGVSESRGFVKDHKSEFLSIEQFRIFLKPYFAHLDLWGSGWPGRLECYFECRDPIRRIESAVRN